MEETSTVKNFSLECVPSFHAESLQIFHGPCIHGFISMGLSSNFLKDGVIPHEQYNSELQIGDLTHQIQ